MKFCDLLSVLVDDFEAFVEFPISSFENQIIHVCGKDVIYSSYGFLLGYYVERVCALELFALAIDLQKSSVTDEVNKKNRQHGKTAKEKLL